MSPERPPAGGLFNLTVTTTNQGGAPAAAGVVRGHVLGCGADLVPLACDWGFKFFEGAYPELAPNETSTQTFTRLQAPGNQSNAVYYLQVLADATCTSVEDDEGSTAGKDNNNKVVPYSLTATPDFEISGLEFIPSTPVQVMRPFAVKLTIQVSDRLKG